MATPLTKQQRRDVLARAPLFAGLGDASLDQLAETSNTRRLARREELFHRGDPGRQVYIVVSGNLKVKTTSLDADDVVFGIESSGDVIGEIALFAECERTATVEALDAALVLAVDRRDFLDVVRRQPEVAISLLEVLARRVKHLSEFVEDTLFLNLPFRLAKQLERLSEAHGSPGRDGVKIELRLTQEEWGDLVGATREAVNKQLKEWREQGLIRFDAGFITIREPERIRALAAEESL